MVPPGPHVVSYNSHGSQGDFGPTTAFFIHPTGGQVLVWTWNPTLEMLETEIDKDKIAQYTKAVQSFQLDANLAPYDLRRYPTWQGLSSHVSPVVIQRLSPIGGAISALYEEDAPPQTDAEVALEKQLAEFKQQQRKGKEQDEPTTATTTTTKPQRCYYTPITRLVKRSGLSPAQLTALNMDKSSLLEEMVISNRKGTGTGTDDATWLLGEFQYSFLAFLLGHSAQGFTQWRAIATLFLGCEDAAVGSRTALFIEFINVFGAQLEFALGGDSTISTSNEGRGSKNNNTNTMTDTDAATAGMVGLVDDLLLEDSFLSKLTLNWLDNILQLEQGNGGDNNNNNMCPPELHSKARHLKFLVTDELGWGGKGGMSASGGGRGRGMEVKANEGGTSRRVKGYDSSDDEEEGDGEEEWEGEDRPVFVDPADLVKAGIKLDDGREEEEDMVEG